MDERALELIDRIYAAALDPDAWIDVVRGFSDFFGGGPVLLTLNPSLEPGPWSGTLQYAVGIEDDYARSYWEFVYRVGVYSSRYSTHFADHWGDMRELVPDFDLPGSDLYANWLAPQGLAPRWPVGLTILDAQGDSAGGFSAFTREGEDPIPDERLKAAGQFIPHLRRAAEIRRRLLRAQRVHLALSEAIDRLPVGLLLLDAQRQVVIQNRSAVRIDADKDGLRIDAQHGPSAEDARENAELQKLLADALESSRLGDLGTPGFLSVSRPSGKRNYALMVTPLVPEPVGWMDVDAVVAVFVADQDGGGIQTGAGMLEELYELTHSEAELVRLLSAGATLEEAAQQRGISLNTARSHLKHAFAKTGTKRQGELVRLIVTGVGQIRER